jgi:hypothetical protein
MPSLLTPTLNPEKEQGAGWVAPGPVWMLQRKEKSVAYAGVQTPRYRVCSLVIICIM